ncbi:MAG: zf-HC2 domain-containing protein [Deltaproteobacteria bacterium]
MSCKEFEESLTLSPYDEMPPEARARFDSHLATCVDCRARLDEMHRLHNLLSESRKVDSEPSPQFLAECRIALDEAIDRELSTVSWKKLLAELWDGMTSLPATRVSWALAVLLFGVGLGWTLRPVVSKMPGAGGPSGQNENTTNQAGTLSPDLSNARINSITPVTSTSDSTPTGEVRITWDAERRMTLQGSLDDPHIREILENALKSYSNPGIRRDSLAVLQHGAGRHPSVRDAMLYALENDPNPGVRLEALRTVRNLDWSPGVQQALVQAVAPENNPGLRVAALDILMQHADKSTLPVFKRLAADDSNGYVRMKAIRAVRFIEDQSGEIR